MWRTAIRKGAARKAVAVAVATVGVAALAPVAPAHAVGGNCSSRVGHQARTGPDYYRVEAICSSLQADSKARGELDVWGPNSYTSWFTAINSWRYSSWGDFVNVYGSNVQIAHI
ncbi:MAG TPA: hypothetical protein VNV66_02685 [Pilimelia sp.]|nr:hypothetical protein [Pilimelia sp.]